MRYLIYLHRTLSSLSPFEKREDKHPIAKRAGLHVDAHKKNDFTQRKPWNAF